MTPTLASYSARVAQKIPNFQTDAYCAIPMSPEISSNVHFPVTKTTTRNKAGLETGGEWGWNFCPRQEFF